MNCDHTSDDGYDPRKLEARREWAIRVSPAECKNAYPEEEFTRRFLNRWVYKNIEIMRAHEQESRVLHCVHCIEEASKIRGFEIRATRLHISYEPDVLGNYPRLMKGYCHSCLMEETIAFPTAAPDYSSLAEIMRMPGGHKVVAQIMRQDPSFKDMLRLTDGYIHNTDLQKIEQSVLEHERRRQMAQVTKKSAPPPPSFKKLTDFFK
jgi:hypothetical protein